MAKNQEIIISKPLYGFRVKGSLIEVKNLPIVRYETISSKVWDGKAKVNGPKQTPREITANGDLLTIQVGDKQRPGYLLVSRIVERIQLQSL